MDGQRPQVVALECGVGAYATHKHRVPKALGSALWRHLQVASHRANLCSPPPFLRFLWIQLAHIL
jgi:hypothetical protein